MTIKEYQTEVNKLKVYPEKLPMIYPTLGLCGEAGEVSEKVKKVYRDNDGEFTPEKTDEIIKELGDVLWYICALTTDLGRDLDEVFEMNVSKLLSRRDRNVIHGDGDNR